MQGVEWSELWVSKWVKPTCTSEGCEHLSLWTDWHILVCRNHTKPAQGESSLVGPYWREFTLGTLSEAFLRTIPVCYDIIGVCLLERQNRCNYLLISFCFIKIWCSGTDLSALDFPQVFAPAKSKGLRHNPVCSHLGKVEEEKLFVRHVQPRQLWLLPFLFQPLQVGLEMITDQLRGAGEGFWILFWEEGF